MKKALKIFLITLGSLLLVLIVGVCILLWQVFTPDKLTPVVRNQAAKYLTCSAEVGNVELTFFSTFPQFGLKVNHLVLVNPIKDAPNDTLVSVENLVGIIDLDAWFKKDLIKIDELLFQQGTVNIFYDSLGNSNYDIMKPMPEDTTESAPLIAGLEDVSFENVNFSYVDFTMPMLVSIQHLTGDLNGIYTDGTLSSDIAVEQSVVSLNYGGEKYLTDVATRLNMKSDITISPIKVVIKEVTGSLNGFPITAAGSLVEDTLAKNMAFDMEYTVAQSPIEGLLKMVPPSYQSYFEGITASGQLAADGTINGIYSDSTMPMFGVHLLVENGVAKYGDVPLVLNDLNGEVTIATDVLTDSLTFVRIDWAKAKTGKSSFSTKGLVTRLFSDMQFDFTTDADLVLSEFKPMIPADMHVAAEGNMKGQVRTAFSMAQLDKMEIGKMKFSGALALSDFKATYDSMYVNTHSADVKFDLPNSKAESKETKFVFADISAKKLSAGIIDSLSANLGGAHLSVELSNVMDTTRVPNVICSFSVDSLAGAMDTVQIALSRATGKIKMDPRAGHPDQPAIQLAGHIRYVDARMGKDTLRLSKVDLNTEIVNQKEQKDVFLQWMPKGTIGLEKGHVAMSGMMFPVDIPAIKLAFSPESLLIEEGKVTIDKSDFALSGSLTNLLSYYRGDSILRGDLKFNSDRTDLLQLMVMTSGIGYEEEAVDTVSSTQSSGPYMVPKGMGITLKTNVKKATFGVDTITNINGSVRVHDGILLLDELKLTSPAARMQVTAMYRTPRKNHLFVGLDFHLLDIEIEELLQMIPDIDTIMPMLRSFRGKGEFHIAAETYLDSLYNPKKSTLRGAASITGHDLVLMDGETFTEIAKTLKFNKKTENRVDSLSAEFTIFKNEIDVYPFLIVMDKYKAVVAGRHNLDMSFDYHISVVDCPLPLKLGVDIKGTMDNMKYSLAKCRYAELYRPTSRKVVENSQLELRKMIREALVKKVKEE